MVFNATGRLADEERGEPLNGLFDNFHASGNRAFTHASDAAIGFNFEKKIIAIADGVLAGDEFFNVQARSGVGKCRDGGKKQTAGKLGG